MRRLAGFVGLGVLVATCAVSVHGAWAEDAPAAAADRATEGAADAPPAELKVAFQDGKLSVKAAGADLVLMLRRIGRWAGIGVQIGVGVSGAVTTEFTGLTLEEGINRVLEAADARDYAAVFEKASPAGAPILRNIAVVRKGAEGCAPSWASFSWPPKKKAILKSSGKEIEYFKGLFVIIPGLSWDASRRGVERMSFEENVRHIESLYSLKMIKGPAGRDFVFQAEHPRSDGKYYLFVSIGEADEVALLRRLNREDHVMFASLYGMGGESAVLPTDEKGRFRLLDAEESDQLRTALEGKSAAQREHLVMEAMPWLKKKCQTLQSQEPVCVPYVVGRIEGHIRTERIKDVEWLEDKVLEVANDFNGVLVYRRSVVEGIDAYSFIFPSLNGEETYAVMQRISSQGFPAAVESWDANPFRSDDPYAGHQWALTEIRAELAWTLWSGRSPSRPIDVAVVDTGIGLPPDPGREGQFLPQPHPDFYTSPETHTVNLDLAKGFTPGARTGAFSDVVDTHGHGTMVSGIISAVGNNARGIDGVAYSQDTGDLMHVVPLRWALAASFLQNQSALYEALQYAVEMRLPVVNMSLGIEHSWQIPAYVQEIYAYGGVIAVAGPNEAHELCNVSSLDTLSDLFRDSNPTAFDMPGLPNAKSLYDKMLMVTSTDEGDAVVGACATSVLLDVAAPGENVLSLRPFNLMVPDDQLPPYWFPCPECIDASGQPDLGYMKGRGTSFATPHVSATAALVLAMGGTSEREAWVWQEKAYSAIPRKADSLGETRPYGRLNMAATMDAIVTDTTPPNAPTGLWLSREAAPPDLHGNERLATVLRWNGVSESPVRYKVYRSEQPGFQVGSETFICYADEPELRQIDQFVAGPYDPFHYRVTAVDQAGNESEPTEAVSLGYDFVFMVGRSSRWVRPRVGYTDSYYESVKKLVGALAEKVPNGSRVGVLVFREQVYGSGLELHAVDGAADGGQRRTWSGDFALEALDLPHDPEEPWSKDTWFLDISEVLEGANEDTTWRGTAASAQGETDAMTLLGEGDRRRNRIGILISDWYDNSLVGSANPQLPAAIYARWRDSMLKFAESGDLDLKNVILHSLDQFFWATPEDYLASLGVTEDTRTWMMAAIGTGGDGQSDAKILKWDPSVPYDTSVLEDLTHCRDNLLNVASRVKPGERPKVPLRLDGSVQDVGVLLYGEGLSHRLIRPDGTVVELERVDGVLRSRDPLVYFRRFEGMGVERYALNGPVAGEWTIEVDGTGLTQAVNSQVLAFGTTGVRLDPAVPRTVRPGELFEIGGRISDTGVLADVPQLAVQLVRPGNVYELGSRKQEHRLSGDRLPGGSIAYRRQVSIGDVEGSLGYRLLFEGSDAEGHAVSREVSGSLFVKGDAPAIAALTPEGEIAVESPLVTAVVGDDVRVQGYTVRVDGKSVPVVAADVPGATPSQTSPLSGGGVYRDVRRLTGRVTWALAPGEHTVEVTATDTIGQQAPPEVWTFRVGPGLVAADPVGDDRGPGWYTHPTDPAVMPRGALDIEGFRVLRTPTQVSFNVDLKKWFTSGSPALKDLPTVADVCLDTDAVAGSGSTELLAGRNARVRAADAWEHCVTISREGARLVSASGATQELEGGFVPELAA